MATQLEPVPHTTPLVTEDRTITSEWYRYLSAALLGRLNAAVYTKKAVTRASTAGALGATALAQGDTGLYRVSWNVRITQAATTSSSLTVTIAATDGGVAVLQVGPALTGNTITTVQSGTFLVRADAATPITYAVAYASVGATVMRYTISFAIELVS